MAQYKWINPLRHAIPSVTAQRTYLSWANVMLVCGLLLSHSVLAAPWINAGDERTRHHLQALVDSGVISAPITAWPVMWATVKESLDGVDPLELNRSQLWSYQYLKHELRQNSKTWSFDKQLYLSNSDLAISEFSSDAREEHQASIAAERTGDASAFRLQINYAHEPSDRQPSTLDGSYLTKLLGNWALGVGSIDRWWGPGWQASMILSNNARPIPGVFIQRNSAEAFDLPLLRYLGPWQLTSFMSQMESNRTDHPRPRLWGARLNFRPTNALEIGLSRTAMWAGKGRPGDADTFLNLLLGHDNRGDDGTDELNEPGNQLAGFDARWSTHFKDYTLATYAQLIGEDEANGMPSRHIGMAGIELQSLWRTTHWRVNLEAHNSAVYFYNSDKDFKNVAYEHSIYSDGYRYHDRAIGASTDNDTESVTLAGQAYFDNGHSLYLKIAHYRLNYDGTIKPALRGSAFGASDVNTRLFESRYSLPISTNYAVTLGGFYFTEDITFQQETLNIGGYLQINARW